MKLSVNLTCARSLSRATQFVAMARLSRVFYEYVIFSVMANMLNVHGEYVEWPWRVCYEYVMLSVLFVTKVALQNEYRHDMAYYPLVSECAQPIGEGCQMI